MPVRLRDEHFERRYRLHHHRLGFKLLEPATNDQAFSLALLALEFLLFLQISVDLVADILILENLESLRELFGKGDPVLLDIARSTSLFLSRGFREAVVGDVALRSGRLERRDRILQVFESERGRLNTTEGGSHLFVVCNTLKSVLDRFDAQSTYQRLA